MRPLTVITGIVLGSSASITFSLAAVMFIFLILGSNDPRVAHEFNALPEMTLIFLTLTAIAAMSFYSLLKGFRSRWWLQGALWLTLAATVIYVWP